MKKTSRKGAEAQSVRSPRVSNGSVSNDALPDGRASDTLGFPPTLGEVDLHLFGEGKHEVIYEKLGAHPRKVGTTWGVSFAVWAPHAEGVSVVGNFNGWDGRLHQMRMLGSSGVWELFI